MARILVVDDESSVRALLAGFLRGTNHEVAVAENADEAMDLLAAEDLDVVLADIILPRTTGVSLLRSIKQASPHVQVILMTGAPTVESASEAVRLGAFDYLAKPFNEEELLKTVANAVRVKALDDERRRLVEENRSHQENLERLVEKRTAALRESEKQMELALQGLRGLSVRLQKVREDERTMIAREIHDELGQALTGVRLDLAWQHQHLPVEEKELKKRARSTITLVDQTIDRVRDLSSRLRPSILDDLGVPAAIEWYAQDFAVRTGIACELDLEADLQELDAEQATAVFRITQEALTNVARHAEADRCEIRLRAMDGHLTLRVVDNGKGIGEGQVAGVASLGLLGMKERAMAAGGSLEIRGLPRGSTEEGGTAVTLLLPLTPDH